MKNKNYLIKLYLFLFDLYKNNLTNLILFFKRKQYLKEIIKHKSEQINISMVKKKINEITKSLNIKNNIKVTKLGDNMIFISSKSKIK